MTKSRTNRLGMYADVREVADLALAHNGGEYECATNGEAVHWTQRFYRFRKLYASIYHEDGSDSPYDRLIIPRVKPPSTIVKINLRQHVGTFRPAGGRVATDLEGDLFDVAEALRKKIQGE